MQERKFFEQDFANSGPSRVRDRNAFGSTDARRARFGQAGLPYFGGLEDLAKDQRGVAMIEYALLCALLALAMLSGATRLSSGVGSLWGDVHDKVADAMGGNDGGSGGSGAGAGGGPGDGGGGSGNGNNGGGNGRGHGNGGGNGNAGGNGNGNGHGNQP